MPRARRPSTPVFETAPYEPDEQGRLRALLPPRCPFADPRTPDCDLGVHHLRERKTGPRFAIAVVRCKTHPVHAFTVYPPGHVPYGRVAVARCSITGPVQLDPQTREPSWDGTVLDAALQAADAVRWPQQEPVVASPGVRRTQGRRLDLAGLLLGVHPDLDDGLRERIAARLRVPTLLLRQAASTWSSSWTARGAAILCVLALVPVDLSLLDRLLSAG